MSETLLVLFVCALTFGAQHAAAQEKPTHWTHAGWGGGGFYWSVAYHPTQTGVIYLGGDVAGAYKSTDHGLTWKLINNGLIDYAVYALAVDPSQPDTVYAGTTSGLCKSQDAGETWRFLEQTGAKALKITSERGKSVRNIAVDPGSDGKIVFAGTVDGRIVRSTDGGATWSVVHTIADASIATIAAARVGPNGSTVVLAATSKGLVRSADGGKTWKNVASASEAATSVAFAASDAQIAYAGIKTHQVIRSTDAGATWTPVGAGVDAAFTVSDLAVSPVDPNVVAAIAHRGWDGACFLTSDAGATWKPSSTIQRDLVGDPTLPQEGDGKTIGLSNSRNIAIDSTGSELYIAGNWRGCWSGDGGQTWQERMDGADITCTYDIQFADGRTYATAMDEGVLASDDQGDTWRQLSPRRYDKSVSGHQWRVLAWDKGRRILTTASPWDQPINQVMLSQDGGETFNIIRAGLPEDLPTADTMWGRSYPRALAADPKDPNTIYLGMDGDPTAKSAGGGVFKSTDGGQTFARLPAQPKARRAFFALAVDPTDSERVYWGACGTAGGLYRSEDAGASWQRVFDRETWVFNVLVAPDGTVYCPGTNLWASSDHGKTWRQLTKRTDGATIIGLAVDPTNPRTLWYSATNWSSSANPGGVYRSDDAGKTWTEITGDLPCRKPLVLRFNPETRQLWAGGVGLFRTAQ